MRLFVLLLHLFSFLWNAIKYSVPFLFSYIHCRWFIQCALCDCVDGCRKHGRGERGGKWKIVQILWFLPPNIHIILKSTWKSPKPFVLFHFESANIGFGKNEIFYHFFLLSFDCSCFAFFLFPGLFYTQIHVSCICGYGGFVTPSIQVEIGGGFFATPHEIRHNFPFFTKRMCACVGVRVCLSWYNNMGSMQFKGGIQRIFYFDKLLYFAVRSVFSFFVLFVRIFKEKKRKLNHLAIHHPPPSTSRHVSDNVMGWCSPFRAYASSGV